MYSYIKSSCFYGPMVFLCKTSELFTAVEPLNVSKNLPQKVAMLLQLCVPLSQFIGRLLELSYLIGNGVHFFLIGSCFLFEEDEGCVDTGDTVRREKHGGVEL